MFCASYSSHKTEKNIGHVIWCMYPSFCWNLKSSRGISETSRNVRLPYLPSLTLAKLSGLVTCGFFKCLNCLVGLTWAFLGGNKTKLSNEKIVSVPTGVRKVPLHL